MAENSNPGDKTLENSTKNKSKNQKSKKTSEVKVPDVVTDNIIIKQEAEKMEIHANHLHRAPGKKIWHYFFEFLMLFLAVFCGFIAENWREQLREHSREKEFIHSIVEDIKSDTLQSNKTIVKLKRLKSGIDSVLIELSSPEIIKNSNNAYRLWGNNQGLEVFVSNDRTIQQLKNSGELRLIRNKAVSDSIMKYDQILKKYYVQSNLMYGALRDMTSYSQLFDFISLNKNKNIQVPLTEQGKKLLNPAFANLQQWNKGLIGLISWLKEVNEQGTSLLIFIKKEYHLE
jgi:hypothetical protein